MVPFLAVSAAAGYALLRPAYDGFYGSLGLRPEDVGLNQAQMLSLGVLAGAAYGTTLAIAWLLGYVVYLMARDLDARLRMPLAVLLIILAQLIVSRGVWGTGIIADLLSLVRSELSITLLLVGLVLLLHGPLTWVANLARRTFPKYVRRRITVAGITVVVLTLLLVAAVWGRFVGQELGKELINDPEFFSQRHSMLLPAIVSELHPVEIVPLTGDKLGICLPAEGGSRPEPYLLGRGSAGAYVLVFRSDEFRSAGRVAWLPSSDYGVFSAYVVVGCQTRETAATLRR